jgi:hypothetical protein
VVNTSLACQWSIRHLKFVYSFNTAENSHLWQLKIIIVLLALMSNKYNSIELNHPLDGVTNPKYKLLCFLSTIFFYKEKKALFLIGMVLPSNALFTADALPLSAIIF